MTPAEIAALAEGLSDAQQAVLAQMSEDIGHRIASVAGFAKRPLKETRQIMQDLHRDGLADFGPLFDHDDGGLRGCGYTRSMRGTAVIWHLEGQEK